MPARAEQDIRPVRPTTLTEGPLFKPIRKSGRVRNRWLTQRSICRISGHSLRVGSAQSLASAGASLVEMQLAGRWRSPCMPGRYARGQLAKRGAVARLRYNA